MTPETLSFLPRKGSERVKRKRRKEGVMSSVLLFACIFLLSSLGGISGDAVDNVIYELAKSIAKSQVIFCFL